MRRPLWLITLAAASFLVGSAVPATGSTPIPGTSLQVVELGPVKQAVPFRATANFSWGVFNGGPPPYTLNVTATATDPSFEVEVFPSSFTIARDTLREVRVNVTTPADGEGRTATIRVRFETTAPVVASLEVNAILTARATPASVDVMTAFLAIGAVIAIGFTASLIFERTRVPDLLILIFLGILLGPIAVALFQISFVPPGALEVATPYFTALALMFILFDGGLNLRISEIVKNLGIVGLHTGLTFVGTVFAVAFVSVVLLGYGWLVGLLLGAVLSGTSGAVVIGIVRSLHVSPETKIILTLESVITDVLSVVTALALLELLRSGPGAPVAIVFTDLGQAFLVSLAFGLVAGFVWLLLLKRLEGKPFAYMLTIAVLFALYAVSETSGGSGAMASFVFGLVLGNHVDFARRFRIRARFVIDDQIKQFHSELAFVIRTFFFVFLGVSITFEFAGAWHVSTALPVLQAFNGTFTLFFLGVLAIFGMIVAIRVAGARVVTAIRPKPPSERRILWSLMGRGLASAVLASLPFTLPAFTSPTTAGESYYQAVLAPYESQFINIAFLIILLTVIATTIGVVASERSIGRAAPKPVMAGVDGVGLNWLRELDIEDVEISEEPPRPRR